MKEMKKKQPDLTDEEAAQIAASKIADSKPKSRMYYKIGASREMAGAKKVDPKAGMSDKLKGMYNAVEKNKNYDWEDTEQSLDKPIVEFQTPTLAVLEDAGKFFVTIVRHGPAEAELTLKVDTQDGSAKAGEDYIAVHQLVTMKANAREAKVQLEVLNDDAWEPDEDFYLKLSLPKTTESTKVKLGKNKVMTITTLNDDEPGTFGFNKRGHFVKESCGHALLTVFREDGADGVVHVKWKTVDQTALSGKDFVGEEGVLEFKAGEVQKDIQVQIINDMSANGKEEYFEVELYGVTEGAKLGSIKTTKVTIADDEEFQDIL